MAESLIQPGALINPGYAITGALEDAMTKRAAAKRQAMLDQITQQREAREGRSADQEYELRKQGLEINRMRVEEAMSGRDEKRVTDVLNGMTQGDIPSAADVKLIQRTGHGSALTPTTVSTPPGQSMVTLPGSPSPVPMPGAQPAAALPLLKFAGSKAEREKNATDEATKAVEASMAKLKPGSPEWLQQALELERVSKRPLSAAILKLMEGPQAATANTEAVLRVSPDRKTVERFDPPTQKWVPLVGEPPKGAHWLQEPQPSQAGAGRADTRMDNAYKTAIAEWDKQTAPIQSQVAAINELGLALNEKTPQADALIAPLVLKATVSGAGTGFRMTQPEINAVVGGRSKWESLKAALMKWSSDPKQALSITDEQRDELRSLAKAVRSKATDKLGKATKARHSMDDATSVDAIHKIMTGMQDDLYGDLPDTIGDAGGGGGGLPPGVTVRKKN